MIDFGPKSAVDEGAVVKLSGRYYVIAVSTDKFTCHGREFMGISKMAPIFEAIEGARAGETVQFRGRSLTVEEVASSASASGVTLLLSAVRHVLLHSH